MSVLTYIYPREPQRLAFDSLLKVLSAEGLAVSECEEKRRAIPNWTYLLLSHKSFKHLQFELVVGQNRKTNIEWVAERHAQNRNFQVVRDAKKYIRSRIKTGNASDRELTDGFEAFDLVICLIARLSKGVVDLPENDRLYSHSGFARYKNAKALRTAKSE